MKNILASVKSFFGKRSLLVGSFLLSSFAAMAEGEGGAAAAPTFTNAATTAVTDWVTGISNWIATIAPHVASLLGAIFGITLIFVVFKWISRGTKKG